MYFHVWPRKRRHFLCCGLLTLVNIFGIFHRVHDWQRHFEYKILTLTSFVIKTMVLIITVQYNCTISNQYMCVILRSIVSRTLTRNTLNHKKKCFICCFINFSLLTGSSGKERKSMIARIQKKKKKKKIMHHVRFLICSCHVIFPPCGSYCKLFLGQRSMSCHIRFFSSFSCHFFVLSVILLDTDIK